MKWSYNKNTPYVPSPVLAGYRLYFLDNQRGVDVLTPERAPLFEAETIPGLFNAYSSPVASRTTSMCRVAMANAPWSNKATSWKFSPRTTGEGVDASLAIVGNELLIRGKENLYCIAAL